jgi:hypothetical protein
MAEGFGPGVNGMLTVVAELDPRPPDQTTLGWST